MRPAIGLLLNAEYPISKLVELARLAEEVGYQYLWYTDVRFLRECYIGLSAVACSTERIRLGPGVTDPYSRHIAITAASIATLDELSGGRAILGLGVGGAGFRELGLTATAPVAALREAIQAFRGLLAGNTVTIDGKVVSLTNGRLGFAPVRNYIPIYVATQGTQIARLAGKLSDGVLVANTLAPNALAYYLKQIYEGADSVDRPRQSMHIALRVEACISEDIEAARDVMLRRVAARILAQYPHWDYLTRLGYELPPGFAELAARHGSQAVEEAANLFPTELLDRMVLAGDVCHVAQQLARVLRPDVAQVTIRPHTTPGQDVSEVIRAFAEKVMPLAYDIASSEDSVSAREAPSNG